MSSAAWAEHAIRIRSGGGRGRCSPCRSDWRRSGRGAECRPLTRVRQSRGGGLRSRLRSRLHAHHVRMLRLLWLRLRRRLLHWMLFSSTTLRLLRLLRPCLERCTHRRAGEATDPRAGLRVPRWSARRAAVVLSFLRCGCGDSDFECDGSCDNAENRTSCELRAGGARPQERAAQHDQQRSDDCDTAAVMLMSTTLLALATAPFASPPLTRSPVAELSCCDQLSSAGAAAHTAAGQHHHQLVPTRGQHRSFSSRRLSSRS